MWIPLQNQGCLVVLLWRGRFQGNNRRPGSVGASFVLDQLSTACSRYLGRKGPSIRAVLDTCLYIVDVYLNT